MSAFLLLHAGLLAAPLLYQISGCCISAEAKHPQVTDARERVAFSELAVASVATQSPHHVDDGPFAVALHVGDETRYLMLQSYSMKASWEHAFRRGRVIERIVEDGARP